MNRTWPAILMTLALPAAAACAGASRPPAGVDSSPSADRPVVRGATGARVDAYFSRLAPFGFSGTVLVAQGDTVVLQKGYGWADRVRGIPDGPGTVYDIESVTKQFTAAAILKLEMEGKLATADSLPRFFDGVPFDKRGITLHELLTHTSGILSGTTTLIPDRSRDGVFAAAMAESLAFAPGTDFMYSNIGYALLAMAVEKVSGEPYESFVRRELFLPAGMTSTGYRRTDWPPDRVAHYVLGGVDVGTGLDRPWPDWNFVGCGEMRSTVGDLFAWHRALLGTAILSAEAKKKLYTPFLRDYAYGWNVETTPHGTCISHNGGSSESGAASFRRYVDAGTTTIVLCNRDGERMLFADRVVDHLDELAFGDSVPLPPAVAEAPPESVAPVAGLYTFGGGDSVRVGLDGGMLALRAYGQTATDLALGIEDTAAGGALTRRAQGALDALAAGNAAPLRRCLADTTRTRLLDYLARGRADGESEMGAFRDYAVLGTAPDWISGLGPWMTVIRVTYARGSDVFRFHWNDRGIVAMGGSVLPEPAMLWIQPVAGLRFAGFHIATGRSAAVTFGHGPTGKVENVRFGSGPRAHRNPGAPAGG